MKALVVVGVAAVALSCRSSAPERAVTAGRGGVDAANTITVAHVSVASATVDYDGKEVQAGPGHQYVLLDARIAAPANDVDFDDFQLVRDNSAGAHSISDDAAADYRPVVTPPWGGVPELDSPPRPYRFIPQPSTARGV